MFGVERLVPRDVIHDIHREFIRIQRVVDVYSLKEELWLEEYLWDPFRRSLGTCLIPVRECYVRYDGS
jgi:hypothetical protein